MEEVILNITKNKNTNKINVINILTYTIIILIVSKRYLEILVTNSNYVIPVKLFLICNLALSIILCIIHKHKYNFYHIAFFAILLIQWTLTGNGVLLFSYIVILALKNIKFDKIVEIYFYSNLFYFITIIVLWNLGIKQTVDIHYAKELGFGNPNTAFISFFMIWLSYLYIKYDSIKIIDIILLITTPIIMYNITHSRTGFMTIIATLIMIILVKCCKKLKIKYIDKIFKFALTFTPIVITTITLIITYIFGEHAKLNTILSSRPFCWQLYLKHTEKPLNLIGYDNNMRWTLFSHDVPMDSGYIAGMYMNGLIVFTIIIFLYMLLIHKLIKSNKIKVVVMIISLLIYSFAESIMLDISTNITLILLASYLDNIKINFKCLNKKNNIN